MNDNRTSTLEDTLSDNVLQAVTAKLLSLSPALQHVLCVAAYTTTSSWDVDTIYALLRYQRRYHDNNLTQNSIFSSSSALVVSTLKELIKLLDRAVLQGLLANSTGSTNYSFEHDRIQQAAFGLVPKGQVRDQFRLSMGLALLALATRDGIIPLYRVSNHQEWMIFASAEHLNASSSLFRMKLQHQNQQDQSPNHEEQHSIYVLVTDPDGDDGDTLTVLNCHVGYLAANKAAYETAGKYLNLAMQELIRVYENPWETQYKLTLKIYSKKVDVELWQGHFEKGRATAEQISTKAKHCNDRLPTQLALAKAFGREEKHAEALRMATNALHSLNNYPGGPLRKFTSLTRNLLFVKRYFRRKRDDEIVSLPLMTDPRYLMAMEFMSVASYQAYYVGNLPEFLVMCLLMLRTSTSHGLCGQSAVALIGYALVCNNLNDMEGAHRFSALSRQVLERTKAKHLEAIQMLVVAHWITGWRDPHPQVLTVFERGYRSGMETGDFENALLCLSSGYHHEYAAGYPLPVLDTKYAKLNERLRMYKIDAILVMSLEQWRKIQHLMGRNSKGEVLMDMNELAKFGPERGNDGSVKYRLLYGYLCRLELAVYFGSFEFAEIMAEKTLEVDSDKSFSTNSLRLFFSGLTYASLARRTQHQRRRRNQYRRKARRCYQELKSLCDMKGLNSWHRCMVLEAHLKGMDGGKEESRVEATYDRAVQCALSSGHVQDAALACHLAGMFFHNLNNAKGAMTDSILSKSRDQLAMKYLHQARGYYLQWGAVGLIRHLEMHYPNLLPPLSRFSDSTSSKLSYVVSDAETTTSPSQTNVLATSCCHDGGSIGLPSMNEDDMISAMTDPWRDVTTAAADVAPSSAGKIVDL